MYYIGKLVVKNYKPLLLEEGMLFVDHINPIDEEGYLQLWESTKWQCSVIKSEDFFFSYGYPVELYLVDQDEEPIAEHGQIAWWNDRKTEQLSNITLKQINHLLKEWDGIVEIDIDEFYAENDIMEPKLFEGKVILRETINEE